MQHPSARQFVLHVERAGRARLEERLAGIGGLSTIRLDPDTLVFELLPPATADPRKAWLMLRDRLGAEVAIDPVLLDDDEHPTFPTGSILVRFRERPRDEDLALFAAKHDLSLRARDTYVPTQATFETTRHDRFLPDLLAALSEERGVALAWADTKLHLLHG